MVTNNSRIYNCRKQDGVSCNIDLHACKVPRSLLVSRRLMIMQIKSTSFLKKKIKINRSSTQYQRSATRNKIVEKEVVVHRGRYNNKIKCIIIGLMM